MCAYKAERELLRKQMEMLAEQSKVATDIELPQLSEAMNDIYKSFLAPAKMTAFAVGLSIANAYLIIGFLVNIKKRLRGS